MTGLENVNVDACGLSYLWKRIAQHGRLILVSIQKQHGEHKAAAITFNTCSRTIN